MRAVREASEQQLFDESVPRLQSLLDEGVTTVEIKSGYGLTLADETKMLRVGRALQRAFPVTIKNTLLAAHTLPPEYAGRAAEYIEVIGEDWLPRLCDEHLVDAVDVFCESIGFDVKLSEQLFESAQRAGTAGQDARRATVQPGRQPDGGAPRRPLVRPPRVLQRPKMRQRWLQQGTVAVLLPVAFYCLAEGRKPPGTGVPYRTNSNGRCERLQPGLGTWHFAAACNEHGHPFVRSHCRRGARGCNAQRSPVLGRTSESRHSRGRQNCRLCHLEHPLDRRAELLDRIQPTPQRHSRRQSHAMTTELGSRPLTLMNSVASTESRRRSESTSAQCGRCAIPTRRRPNSQPVTPRRTESTRASAYWPRHASRQSQRTLLQKNIILSHSAGVGPLLDDSIVRLTMVLKLASLLQGFSGVSEPLVRFLEALINRASTLAYPPRDRSVPRATSLLWHTCPWLC